MDSLFNNEVDFETYRQFLISGFFKVFTDIERSHSSLFDKKDKYLALAFLAQANSFVDTLKGLSLLTEDLSRQEFEEFIHLFNVYNQEMTNNVFTDHSHQWTDIQYINLIDGCRFVANLLNITHPIFK